MSRCRCGRLVIRKSLDGSVRLRAKILTFRPEGTVAVCRCGEEVPVDLTLGEDLKKAVSEAQLLVSKRPA